MKNTRYIIFSFCVLLLLSSCEYQTEENHFLSIDKTIKSKITKLNIQQMSDDGNIYLYGLTALYFSIDEQSNKLIKTTYYIDGKEVPGYFNKLYIDPERYNYKDLDLKIKVELNTGTGSIADKLFLEKYTGDFTYKIKFIKTDFKLNITQEKTEDGKIKIMWKNPNFPTAPVARYEITTYDYVTNEEKTINITNPAQTYFIDEDLVIGKKTYSITTYFKNNMNTWRDAYTLEKENITIDDLHLNIRQQKTIDGHLQIVWDKPDKIANIIDSYQIEYESEEFDDFHWPKIKRIIINKDVTHFIDSVYIYGDKCYNIIVNILNGKYSFQTKYTPQYRKIAPADFKFDQIAFNKVKMTFPKMDFKCKMFVGIGSYRVETIKEINSFELSTILNIWDFPRITPINIYYTKADYEMENSNFDYSKVKCNLTTSFTYNTFNTEYPEHSLIHYHPYSKKTFILISGKLYQLDLKSNKIIPIQESPSDIGKIAFDDQSEKVVTSTYQRIFVYKDLSFKNPSTFLLQNNPEVMKITDDDKLMIWNSATGLFVLDYDSGKYLYSIPLQTFGKSIISLCISKNNKYLLLRLFNFTSNNSSEFALFEINKDKATLIKRFDFEELINNGETVLFNNQNPTQIIQSSNFKTRIIEIPSMQIVKQIDHSFVVIDPITGNFLLNDGRYKIFVYDPELKKQIFSAAVNEANSNSLINNTLYNNRYYIPINKWN